MPLSASEKTGDEYLRTTHSGPDGSYTVTGLVSGNYTVYVYKDGYLQKYFNDVPDASSATYVSVTAPNTTTGIDFSLDKGGTISGHVYLADGVTPVSGATIEVRILTGVVRAIGYSGTDGGYSIGGLMPGEYTVLATKDEYVIKYYGGTWDPQTATPVQVTSNGALSNIDMLLEEGGTIAGHTYDSDGETPLAGVYVWLIETGSNFNKAVSSLEDGSYQVSGLIPGRYTVLFDKSGYPRRFYDNVTRPYNRSYLNIAGGETVSGIDVTMEPGGVISGHVYTNDGTPVYKCTIQAEPLDDPHIIGWGTTNPDGSYEINSMPYGRYRIKTISPDYIQEYYDGTYDEAQAVPVTVNATSGSGIDFILERGSSISGYVYRTDGVTPIPDVRVNVIMKNTGNCCTGAWTASDGSYTVAGLLPGDYALQVQATGYIDIYYGGSTDYTQASTITVGSQDAVTGIDLLLTSAGTISGHVYRSDGVTPVARVSIEVLSTEGSYVWFTETDQSGSYLANNLESGQYYLRTRHKNYIQEYYNDAYDLNQATLVTVTKPEDTPDIDFSLEDAGILTGRVFESDGVTPIPDAWVYILTTDHVSYRNYDVASDGWFEFDSLPPGQYLVKAVAAGYDDEWYLNEQDIDSADVVTITGGETLDIVFTLRDQNAPEDLQGDANGDGSVNVLDITLVVRMILGDESDTTRADVNQDGDVNILDVTKIIKIILGVA